MIYNLLQLIVFSMYMPQQFPHQPYKHTNKSKTKRRFGKTRLQKRRHRSKAHLASNLRRHNQQRSIPQLEQQWEVPRHTMQPEKILHQDPRQHQVRTQSQLENYVRTMMNYWASKAHQYRAYISYSPHGDSSNTSIALSSDTNNQNAGHITVRWDSDSYPIKIDNCCTKSISFDIKDFEQNSLQDAENKQVSGFVANTTTPILKTGTIIWNILDDMGVPRKIKIPNSYYVPGGTSRLLSPQHWAQEAQDHYPVPHGTSCITTSEAVILKWDQAQYTKTIYLNPNGNNVGTLWTEPGYVIANAAIQHVEQNYDPISYDTEVIDNKKEYNVNHSFVCSSGNNP
jgi:hypothetical protein